MAEGITGQETTINVINVSTERLPELLDAAGRLFELLWSKSPPLAAFVIILLVLLPFYVAYIYFACRQSERESDKKVERAVRKELKRQGSRASGGKKA